MNRTDEQESVIGCWLVVAFAVGLVVGMVIGFIIA